MKYLITLLSMIALTAWSQTAGQFELRKYNSGGGMTSFWITPENSKAFGLNGSGVPAMLSVGGSSTLAGLSDVAISSLANLDLLRYNSATSRWENIPGTTYALSSSLSDYLTISDAADDYQPKTALLSQLANGPGIFSGVVMYSTSSGYSSSPFLNAGNGGTGFSVYSDGDLLYGSATSLAKLAGNTSTTKKMLTQTGTGSSSAAPVWENIPTSGITIGTTTSDGTAGRVLYTDGSNVQQYATTGTGDVVRGTSPTITGLAANSITGTAVVGSVGTSDNAIVRADGTGGGTAQGSVATITDAGAPTFYDSLTLLKTGSADSTTLEVASDPLNVSVRALYILPPANSGRVYFGKSGRGIYTLDFSNVGSVTAFPSMVAVAPYSILTYVGNISLQALNGNVMLETVAGGFVQLGANHATTPTAQIIKAHDVTTGTGAKLTLKGGTGSVANGDVVLDGANRASNIADANTLHGVSGGDTVDKLMLETNLNSLGTKINELKAALISHGLMAP